MKETFLRRAMTVDFGRFLFAALALAFFLMADGVSAQTRKAAAPKTPPKQAAALNLPKVTQIDGVMLSNLLKREGDGAKPLLVNFWATWCVPCIEEFPDLVKLDNDFRGKVEIITVSLDDLADIETAVPKFLADMKAEMPAYLLKTQDEEAAISSVSKDWSGALPFTILLSGKGETAYSKQGKFKPDVLRAELEKVIAAGNTTQTTDSETISGRENSSRFVNQQIVELPLNVRNDPYNYEKGIADAKRDVSNGKLFIKRYGFTPGIAPESLKRLKEKYGIEITDSGCVVTPGFPEYVRGYNEVSEAAIKRKYGDKPWK